jgi:hypothetical protein
MANPVTCSMTQEETRSFGGGWPHGIHVDRDGNVWIPTHAPPARELTRFLARAPKGSVVVKFSREGKV